MANFARFLLPRDLTGAPDCADKHDGLSNFQESRTYFDFTAMRAVRKNSCPEYWNGYPREVHEVHHRIFLDLCQWGELPLAAMDRLSHGITRLELIVVVVAAALLTCLIPFLARPKYLANRAVCSANVRGIIQSMIIYAQSNNGQLPCTPGPDGTTYSNEPQAPMNLPAVLTTKAVISAWFGNSKTPHGSDLGNPLACLWLLVLEGQENPKSFICPSDPIATTPSEGYKSTETDNAPLFQPNFGVMKDDKTPNSDGQGESYSIAYPWRPASTAEIARVGSWWRDDDGSKVALVSDMAPADIAATGRDNRITTTLPGDNTFGNYIYNSMNHRGKGQNVGFGDDHVSWNTNPYCGVHHDNIFTYYRHEYTSHGDSAAAPQAGLSELGNAAAVPTILGSKPDYDICMVPVRNGSQYGKKMRRW